MERFVGYFIVSFIVYPCENIFLIIVVRFILKDDIFINENWILIVFYLNWDLMLFMKLTYQ